MSSCYVNISLGNWHFQILKYNPYIRISKNFGTSRKFYEFNVFQFLGYTKNDDSSI
jgi:hypothetical protein